MYPMKAPFGLTLDIRPRTLRDEPRTGGSQPAYISRINRRRIVPSAPGEPCKDNIRIPSFRRGLTQVKTYQERI